MMSSEINSRQIRGLDRLSSVYLGLFRPPNIKLRLKGIPKPPFYLILILLGISAYIIFSGIFYDIINNPPSTGQERDLSSGVVYPVVVARGGMTSQFVLEGFSAGFFFILGGISVSLLLTNSVALTITGLVMMILSYVFLSIFMKVKMPDYPF